MPDNVMTPEFRVSYPFIFRPGKAMDPGQEPKYSVTMLFPPKADLSALKAAAKAAVVEKWGSDQAKWPKGLRLPFRDQGEKDDKSGYVKGAAFIVATSKQRPGLVDAAVQDIIEEREFYAGCYARATIRPFVYDIKGNKGVAFGLQNVQKLREGEPLGGRSSPQADFEPVTQAGNGSSVFDAADDEVPF